MIDQDIAARQGWKQGPGNKGGDEERREPKGKDDELQELMRLEGWNENHSG